MKIGTFSKLETHETKIKIGSDKIVSLFSDKPYTHIISKFAMSDVLEVLAVYVAEEGDNFLTLKMARD